MNSILVIFLVLTLGYLLGRVKIKGLSLGTSGIILVALVFGHYGFSLPKEIQNLGLAYFVTSVGFIAGPVFFANFKKRALAYISVSILIIGIGAGLCILTIKLLHIPTPLCVGLLCGSLTSTPGLAAALEASGDASASIGYGIGYPFGVLGIVLFVQIIPRLLHSDIEKEVALLMENAKEHKTEAEMGKPLIHVDSFGLAPFSVAIVLGMLLGSVKIPLPGGAEFSLGISGGPLLAGLMAGYIGNVGRVSLSVPKTTLNTLREFGLALFLLGAGLSAGNGFLAVLKEHGITLFLIGILMRTIPMIAGFFAFWKLWKIPPFTALGSICGSMTSTPALGCLIQVAGTDLIAASYAATYPIALICVVLASQFICVLM